MSELSHNKLPSVEATRRKKEDLRERERELRIFIHFHVVRFSLSRIRYSPTQFNAVSLHLLHRVGEGKKISPRSLSLSLAIHSLII